MALQEEFEKRGNWLFRYRGTLPLIVLIAGLFLYLRGKIYPETYFPDGIHFENYYEYFCLLISLSGLIIRIYTIGYTPENTSGRNVKEQVAGKLNTTGIYSLVRHPLYVGNFFMWLGPALLTGHIWFIILFCLAYWLYYERIMFAEEQFLKGKFGDPYLKWSMTAPPFFPKLSGWQNANLKFSLRNVLKREYNGLFALGISFAYLNVLKNFISTKKFMITDFWLYTLAVTFLIFIIQRTLKKTTRILNVDGR
ncbi:MAG: DUF1295 domain-containing protein [Bacteroidales bacterium]|nr:DUF1295 domain-containing protein [Bacteroidales bacterium]